MKKILVGIITILAVVIIAGMIFQEPLKEAVFAQITSDMFVAEDQDGFDPGLGVGETFPPIDALMAGQAVSDVSNLAGPKGLIFVANRSVDW